MMYSPRRGQCNTTTCRQAVYDLERLIDYSVEPCENFYDHVCRRWEEKQRRLVDDGPINFLNSRVTLFLRYVNDSLSSEERATPVSADFFYAAKFYRSCERFLSAPNVSLREVLLPFRKYGEEILNRSSFTSVVRHIVELSLARGITTFLDIQLRRFPDGVFLRILRGQTLSQKLGAERVLPLQEYLEEVLNEASTIHGREFNLTYVLEIEQHLQNYTSRERHEQRQRTTVLQNLSTALHREEWLNILNTHLPEAQKLDNWSTLFVDNVEIIRELMSFFRGIVDYGVVYLYVQVLLDALRFDYLRRLNTSNSELIVASCLQTTRLVMRTATSAILNVLFPRQSTDVVVHRVFRQVRQVVSDGSAFAWMSEVRREEARRRLREVSIHQFRTARPLNGKQFKYDLTGTSTVSKFPSLFIRLKKRQQQSILEDPPVAHQANIDDALFLSSDVLYDNLSNTLIIPAFMRREPIVYVDTVQPEFNMGTLGVLLAGALLQAALPPNTPGPWAQFEKASFHRYDQCLLARASSALNVSLHYARDNDHPELYVWSHSARSAYGALMKTYEHSVAAKARNSWWQSAQETFFRRFCLLSCSLGNERQRLDSANSFFLPLLNMKEFSKVFDCKHTSAEQTEQYCVL
ncbi:uncharacterized protein LOC142559301 [Dermacentor variabilis]|uniref:uncharacterized protein LOC142559301 n=1 Tax=Dermacentor variabilis TaxID=34621 RepID=UPI003F5C3999